MTALSTRQIQTRDCPPPPRRPFKKKKNPRQGSAFLHSLRPIFNYAITPSSATSTSPPPHRPSAQPEAGADRQPSVLAQALPHALPTPLAKLLARAGPVLAQQLGRLGVGGALVVGARKEADDAEQDGLGGLHGAPALGGALVAELVLLGRVQDRYAQQARVRVDVGVEGDRVLEGEGRRHEGVLRREAEAAAEVGACSWGRGGGRLGVSFLRGAGEREDWGGREIRLRGNRGRGGGGV